VEVGSALAFGICILLALAAKEAAVGWRVGIALVRPDANNKGCGQAREQDSLLPLRSMILIISSTSRLLTRLGVSAISMLIKHTNRYDRG
jgi:hypothetical protein